MRITNLFSFAAIFGGILWLVLNAALVGAWERGNSFPTYEFLNGLRPLPLALYAFAQYMLYRAVNVGRTSTLISLAGFALLALGSALEFWVGGGVRDGEVDTLSLAGWLTYLLGYLILSIGLVTFGIAIYRARALGAQSLFVFITGVVWASWFPLIMLDNALSTNYADIAQYVFALLWIVTGFGLRQDQPSRTIGIIN